MCVIQKTPSHVASRRSLERDEQQLDEEISLPSHGDYSESNAQLLRGRMDRKLRSPHSSIPNIDLVIGQESQQQELTDTL